MIGPVPEKKFELEGTRVDLGELFVDRDVKTGASCEPWRHARNGPALVPGISGEVFNLIGRSAYFRACGRLVWIGKVPWKSVSLNLPGESIQRTAGAR